HIEAGANHVSVQVLSSNVGELPSAEWRELATALNSFN
ncbi:MAG: LLM class F420-dependent oxidoreductase, partial [Actinobacteria bacterium]|nr:LLM class F420-dependent oxidoreductase [Actinomycetota bacterium]